MDLLNFEVIAAYRHVFLRGLGLTIFLTVVTMVLASFMAIPLAMGALLHPVIAETAMALSSISVILNSMRIRAASGPNGQR